MAVLPSSRIFAKVFFSLHVYGALTQGTPAPFPTVTAHGFRLQLFELSCNWLSSLRELSCNSSFTVRGVSFNLQNFGRPSNAAGYVIRNSSCSMSHCLSPERPWHRHPPVCCSDHARCRPRVSTASEHLLDTQHEQHGVLLRTSLVSTQVNVKWVAMHLRSLATRQGTDNTFSQQRKILFDVWVRRASVSSHKRW